MQPECSLSHSQVPTTCPYPEPDQSIQWSTSSFLKIHFNTILQSMPGSFKLPLSIRFPHQKPVYASPLPPNTYTIMFILDRASLCTLKNKRPTWCHNLLSFISLLLFSTCFGHYASACHTDTTPTSHTETPNTHRNKNTQPVWWYNRKVAGSWRWMY